MEKNSVTFGKETVTVSVDMTAEMKAAFEEFKKEKLRKEQQALAKLFHARHVMPQ